MTHLPPVCSISFALPYRFAPFLMPLLQSPWQYDILIFAPHGGDVGENDNSDRFKGRSLYGAF